MSPKTAEPTEEVRGAPTENVDAEETPEEAREFDEILERAAPKIDEMARRAREAKREGRVMKFPA